MSLYKYNYNLLKELYMISKYVIKNIFKYYVKSTQKFQI